MLGRFVVYCPSQELFITMEKSLLVVKGCRGALILGVDDVSWKFWLEWDSWSVHVPHAVVKDNCWSGGLSEETEDSCSEVASVTGTRLWSYEQSTDRKQWLIEIGQWVFFSMLHLLRPGNLSVSLTLVRWNCHCLFYRLTSVVAWISNGRQTHNQLYHHGFLFNVHTAYLNIFFSYELEYSNIINMLDLNNFPK